jgi:broad specificity phosphatase PhoE
MFETMMNGPMSTSNGSTSTTASNNNDSRTYTLYLLRHGEAAHNLQEKCAMQRAQEAAVADGLQADSPETRLRMEEARQAILEDKSFFDAPLSDKGKGEAAAARKLMQELTCGNSTTACTTSADATPATWCWLPPLFKGLVRPAFSATNTTSSSACWLPPPTEVLVSPLQRTLQTADLVFPDLNNIRVRDELRERLTGRPADNRVASSVAQQQFSRFSFVHLRLNSFFGVRAMTKLNPFMEHGALEECEHENSCTDDDYDDDDDEMKEESTPSLLHSKQLPPISLESSFNADQVQEDEDKLRRRTMKLFELLSHSRHESVAVITHKGFLRSLEQGAFGQPDATEFKNCELRVYRITFSRGAKILDHVERLR